MLRIQKFNRRQVIALGIAVLMLAVYTKLATAVEATVPSFDIFTGQVLSLGRLVHVRVPSATEAEFFFQTVDGRKRIRLGQDDGTHPPIANGPGCDDPPCTVPDEFAVLLGDPLKNVKDGPATLLVVSPIGSGQVVASRSIYWARFSPRAAIRQPGFGARVPQTGIKVVARTQNTNIVDIKVIAVRPFGSCGPSHVPPFEQHWLGTELGFEGNTSCAPTSLGAAFQFLEDNGLANVVPNYSDCDLVEDCSDPTLLNQYRCLVTDLGEYMDTNEDPEIVGTPTPFVDGVANFLSSHFGYVEGVDYQGNAETWAGPAETGFPPQRIALEYFAGGAFLLGGNNEFEGVPDDEVFGHIVAVDKVVKNSDGTVDLTIMEPYNALGDLAPHCGAYETYRIANDGTIQYVTFPDNNIYPFALIGIVTFRGFEGSETPGCGPTIPVAGKMINLKWWEGVFVPPAPGPYLLYSETLDAAGHKTRSYQYVVAAGN
jgi:hypothetical protein